MYAGGIADKLGNRYEAKWLVLQFLEVFGGKADSIKFEGIDATFQGFEFSLVRHGVTEWHQTKINSPNGNWTIRALEKEGVLSAFKRRLSANARDICVFVSQHPAKDIDALANKASIAKSCDEYRKSLGKEGNDLFDQLTAAWSVDDNNVYEWLN